jgi:hypothetical protein
MVLHAVKRQKKPIIRIRMDKDWLLFMIFGGSFVIAHHISSVWSFNNNQREMIKAIMYKELVGKKEEEPTNHIDIVVAQCREDLSSLDNFGETSCSNISFHIYTKCGYFNDTNVTVINNNNNLWKHLNKDCVSIHPIDNCGTEEYAYLKHVESSMKNERGLASMTAFVQGGGLTENPHIVADILNYLPGTIFSTLSRHVRDGWHFGKDPI